MSIDWDQSLGSAVEPAVAQSTGRVLATILTAAAVLFNFVLCFVNTNLFSTSPNIVISVEIGLIGLALGLVWYRSVTLYAILLLLTAYFFSVMLIRFEFDAKIVRDLLIPIIFFFVGRHLGTVRSADRLVAFLIIVAFGVALFEWLELDTFRHYFDVVRYYIARGTITDSATENSLALNSGFFNSSRFSGSGDSRALMPFLGDHRVSGIFLEAPSAGNFSAIIFAWVLLRDRQRYWSLAAKSLAIATMIVLSDARLGLYLCTFTLILYVMTPFIRPWMLFIAPFLAVIVVWTFGVVGSESVDNTLSGRFFMSGKMLGAIDSWQVLGLLSSDTPTGASFALDETNDSGYTYILIKVGLVGVAGLWGLFVYAPVHDRDAWRFKNFIALYYVAALPIVASVFTIKTAALLWFLYGTLSKPNYVQEDAAMRASVFDRTQ
jgi:putative polymerase